MTNDNRGYIKLFRSIDNWDWYKDGNTARVFIHLLLHANIEDHSFQGVMIHRGEIATSYNSIGTALGLSRQNVRTAIDHLKLTHELTLKVYSKFALITILNYDKFQDDQHSSNTQSNTHLTLSQHSSNTNQRMEECKNDKNIYIGAAELSKRVIEYLNQKLGTNYKGTTTKTVDLIKARMNEGFGESDFIKVIDNMTAEWKDDTRMAKFLRPETLFSNKFEGYLNRIPSRQTEQPAPSFNLEDLKKRMMEDIV